jgi:ribonuclease D
MAPNNFHLDPPLFINDQAGLIEAIKDFKSKKSLAVDTEANSLYAYQEQVCLIQVSTDNKDYVIDALAFDDLSLFAEVFLDPSIEKIFHASEYDILIMHEEFNFEFRNLFDTMLAAQILGRERLGLDALLDEFIGIQINKKYQRANWGKRPLPDDMLKYAQVDTHFLFQIRERLAKELQEKDLVRIAEEDFTRACKVHQQVQENKSAPCWKIRGAKTLSPQKAAVLSKLCEYRDETARKINKPVFKVISAQSLLHIAEKCPSTSSQLLNMDLPGTKNLQRHSNGILQAINEGLKAPPLYPPRKERLDDALLAREKALRAWRKRTAMNMKVNSAVVLPRELLNSLVYNNPSNHRELSRILEDVPWRLERFGSEILSVLKEDI